MTLRELILQAEAKLVEGPHRDRARLDVEALLFYVAKRDRAWLLSHSNDKAEEDLELRFNALVTRRKTGEPIQYITGMTEFFGLPFAVTPDVLIPRPETEHVVEEVIRLAALLTGEQLSIADIGTGSGAIAVALAHSLPQAKITATDISPAALRIAGENARRNHVSGRIDFREGDLLEPLAGRRFQVIVSNPPYVPTRDIKSLSVEVREYEPHSALFAGDDGLDVYRSLIPQASEHLDPGARLVVEIGYGQQAGVQHLFEAAGYCEIHFFLDYQGIPRVATARRF